MTSILEVPKPTPTPIPSPLQAAPASRIFDHRVAVVTGGARGIGWAITQALAAAGAHVAAGYHHDRGAAEKLMEEVTRAGGSMSIHSGNVGEPADCQRVVDEVLAANGRIDFLVNNAGVTVDKTVRRMTTDDWHAVLRINLSGPFYMTKAVLEHMIDRGSGRIVNISSVIGQTGSIGQANYAASKSGLFGFSQSLALEMARKGITVNCVAPGYIETEMVAAVPADVLGKLVAKIPVGRLGQGSEVARVVKFLLEDESSYITGAVYTVNGGLEM
ncbi:MAG: acetoacetyl-CoA reductase [Chloroflexota bacterium]|jgi:NAD(P)-dependent dehydrogenase (short-subunit alcohol dehydrogenase family)|nr:acetoacetyl-CoA reductase [Chloroflexota bacterium]